MTFADFKTSKKLLTAFCLVVAAVVVMGGVIVATLGRLADTESLNSASYNLVDFVDQMIGDTSKQRASLLSYVLTGDKAKFAGIVLGLPPAEMVLLAMTLMLATLTFSGARTTILEGAMHLVVFFVYLTLIFQP